MEQKIFSKRKSKIAGLCGAILTTTVVALGFIVLSFVLNMKW